MQSARRRATRTCSEEELQRFLETIDGHRFAVVWHLAPFPGLRRIAPLGTARVALGQCVAGRRETDSAQTVVEGEDGLVADDEQKTRGSAGTIHLDRATVGMLCSHRGGSALRVGQREAAWEGHLT